MRALFRSAFPVFVIAFVASFLLNRAPSAPVPPRVKEKLDPHPAALVGEWTITWNYGIGTAILHPEGGWICAWCGDQWIGSWRVEEGVLIVKESVKPNPGKAPNWYDWRGDAGCIGLDAKLHKGGSFRLDKPKKTKL